MVIWITLMGLAICQPLFLGGKLINEEVEVSITEKVGELHVPNEIEAASIARTLVNRESLANVNTLKTFKQEDGTESQVPVSSMEYYADCDGDGDPYWLVVDIGSTYQNIVDGSDYSFTIRVGDHPLGDHVNPNYPGGTTSSPAGSPRVQLFGKLVDVPPDSKSYDDWLKLKNCFTARHPDSKFWLPENVISPHKTHWVKFVVDKIYFVGGFGDRAYIGYVNPGIYHSVSTIDNGMKK
ncbi:uncharacterized protein KQ657_000505 [Scheffersomyces spartinae]|uniref:CREG-like beta-barrel domain-containing protein n=1 Tax=Scheffersomyces spartinae TaxID=45513 RepID=A0A9P8AHX1_9ASCO|nr:uncharacterized protein KQ657_000505 [Scheffersomyces spartinae]KAG7193812.1 hypothetical protein KQ657_000505 [Scheffersomyces spartinae]